MKIWKQAFTLEDINKSAQGTLVAHLGIEYTEVGEDYLVGRMPVDYRTMQPMRLLHGGASACLAESVGSTASAMCLDDLGTKVPVGLEINANHLHSARSGYVHARAEPIRIGRNIHVWNIDIRDDENRRICVSRLTVAIIDRR